jgi:DNA mismatch endonuclease, patch repair protein
MADSLSIARRSWLMSRVSAKNTKPEMVVRRAAHALGYRFRLHRTDLPGCPDLVFPKLRRLIFVHGCYWHRHQCRKATMPSSNVDFWQKKFAKNLARDKRVLADMHDLGWDAMVVWECETKDSGSLCDRLTAFLSDQKA